MVEITIRKRPRVEAVVTQRKFFKKTARGKVIKGLQTLNYHCRFSPPLVLRERYLRDDVGCGVQDCRECTSEDALPLNTRLQHSKFPQAHFIVPDTNVFLSQVRYTVDNMNTFSTFYSRWILWNPSYSARP